MGPINRFTLRPSWLVGVSFQCFQHKKQPRDMKNETDTMSTVMLPRAALTEYLEPSRVFDLKPCNGKKIASFLLKFRLTQSTNKYVIMVYNCFIKKIFLVFFKSFYISFSVFSEFKIFAYKNISGFQVFVNYVFYKF